MGFLPDYMLRNYLKILEKGNYNLKNKLFKYILRKRERNVIVPKKLVSSIRYIIGWSIHEIPEVDRTAFGVPASEAIRCRSTETTRAQPSGNVRDCQKKYHQLKTSSGELKEQNIRETCSLSFHF